jgi:hypothetical protein
VLAAAMAPITPGAVGHPNPRTRKPGPGHDVETNVEYDAGHAGPDRHGHQDRVARAMTDFTHEV